MEAQVEKNGQPFTARLIEFDGRKVEQFTFNNVVGAMAAKATLQKAANGELTVGTVDKKQRRRHPAPPLPTSTLQPEANRKRALAASRTMSPAPPRNEAINSRGDTFALITAYRTAIERPA